MLTTSMTFLFIAHLFSSVLANPAGFTFPRSLKSHYFSPPPLLQPWPRTPPSFFQISAVAAQVVFLVPPLPLPSQSRLFFIFIFLFHLSGCRFLMAAKKILVKQSQATSLFKILCAMAVALTEGLSQRTCQLLYDLLLPNDTQLILCHSLLPTSVIISSLLVISSQSFCTSETPAWYVLHDLPISSCLAQMSPEAFSDSPIKIAPIAPCPLHSAQSPSQQ